MTRRVVCMFTALALGACAAPVTQVRDEGAGGPPAPRPGAPVARAVVIGVGTYESSALPRLDDAEQDAAAFARVLAEAGTGVVTLIGPGADREAIAPAVEQVRAASRDGDLNVIYFNGHIATPGQNEPAYLLPYKARKQALGLTALDFDQLLGEAGVGDSGARWLLMLEGTHYVKGRGAPGKGAWLLRALVPVLAKRPRMSVLLAGENSLSDNRWGLFGRTSGGAFTYYSVNALQGHADADGDGQVSASELAGFVVKGVKDSTAGGQLPMAVGASGDELVLAKVEPRGAAGGGPKAAAATAGSGERAAAQPSEAVGSGIRTMKDYERLNDLNCTPRPTEVEEPEVRDIGGLELKLTGTRAFAQGRSAGTPLRLGLVGAIKDAEPATLRNLEAALKWFRERKVDAVVVNGDTGYDEMEIRDVLEILGEAGLPTFIVIGNSETIGALHGAIETLSDRYRNLVNLDLVRYVDLGAATLVSLPGYFNKAFIHASGGCFYKDRNLEEVEELAREARSPVILVSHGPPKGSGKGALDFAGEAGNVGDSRINDSMRKAGIRFGIFGHILEAGGQGVDEGGKLVAEKAPSDALFMNTGSVSSVPWQMNNGKLAHGVAAILEIEGKRAKYEFSDLPGK